MNGELESLTRNLRTLGLLLRKVWILGRRRWLAACRSTRTLAHEVEFRVYWVSPADIRYCSRVDTHGEFDRDRVMRGDWDEPVEEFDRADYYMAFEQVFSGAAQWQDTEFHARVLSQMAEGQVKWGCRTAAEFDDRLAFLETLYAEMKEIGYLPNHNSDQIWVNVGRHGDLMFVDGQHRLSFAKLLNLPKVPVMLVARHPEWVRFKRCVIRYALRHGGRVRDPLLHPDLEDVQADFGHKRFDLIRRHLRAQGGSVLDLGSHWGYFSHRFEELGFQCTAVEPDGGNFDFLMKMRRACHRTFEAHHDQPLRYLQRNEVPADVVLAMGLFDDPITSSQGREAFNQLFSSVKAEEMFIMPAPAARPPGQTESCMAARESGFLHFVLEDSSFTHARCIGYVEDRLPVYHVWSDPDCAGTES